MIDPELLNKFFYAPGLCSIFELAQVKKFLLTYKQHHDIYMSVKHAEPLGETLNVELDKVDWYVNYQNNIKN